jgi:hypothetical protein
MSNIAVPFKSFFRGSKDEEECAHLWQAAEKLESPLQRIRRF